MLQDIAENAKHGRPPAYPHRFFATWPGRSIEWSKRQWCVIVWDDDRTTAVSHVGIFDRIAHRNDSSVRIGGIDGVMTHPLFRKQGFARAAINRSIEFFRDVGNVDFALLVCEPTLIQFYSKLDWQPFHGKLVVSQRGKSTEFTFNLPMTYHIQAQPDFGGIIDLQGPPW